MMGLTTDLQRCDECPLSYFNDGMFPADFDCAKNLPPEDCHLTVAYQRIIEAMIDGKWKCKTCKHNYFCSTSAPNDAISRHKPCSLWEERKVDDEKS